MPVTEIIANKTTWDLFQDCLDMVNACPWLINYWYKDIPVQNRQQPDLICFWQKPDF